MKKIMFLLIILFISVKSAAQDIEIVKKDFKTAYKESTILTEFEDSFGNPSINFQCDSLVFRDQIIILDGSPILDWYVSVTNNDGVDIESKFWATWEVVSNRLCLSSIQFSDGNSDLKKNLEKTLKTKFSKGMTVPLTAAIAGGSDCIKTPQGFASKNRYVFKLDNGLISSIELTVIPYGSLEEDHLFGAFAGEEIPRFFPREMMDEWRSKHERSGILSSSIILVSTPEGNASLYLGPRGLIPPRNECLIGRMVLSHHPGDIAILPELFLASRVPVGSLYGRFLKGSIIYPFHPYRFFVVVPENRVAAVEHSFVEKSYVDTYTDFEWKQMDKEKMFLEIDKNRNKLLKIDVE
jgi:hypothetical protein